MTALMFLPPLPKEQQLEKQQEWLKVIKSKQLSMHLPSKCY